MDNRNINYIQLCCPLGEREAAPFVPSSKLEQGMGCYGTFKPYMHILSNLYNESRASQISKTGIRIPMITDMFSLKIIVILTIFMKIDSITLVDLSISLV